MTADVDRLAAIVALGYTEREAAFLDRVARHSGYFVRRQFLQFIGRASGQTVVDFTAKLVARRHATVQTYCHAAHVVHLCARTLYAAAAVDERREHRRRRPAIGIKARLMALDYVLARPTTRFLATEAERLAFCDAAGIDRFWLPQQRYVGPPDGPSSVRYFVDAGPMGLEPGDVGQTSLVLAYIDGGDLAATSFEAFLQRYWPVWAALRGVRVVYVADTSRRFASVTATFRRVWADVERTHRGSPVTDLPAFFDYCRLRRAFDAKDWAALDKAALDRFRDLRLRFGGHDGDRLYGQWETRGEEAVRQAIARPPSLERDRAGELETCVLTHSYVATSPIGGRR